MSDRIVISTRTGQPETISVDSATVPVLLADVPGLYAVIDTLSLGASWVRVGKRGEPWVSATPRAVFVGYTSGIGHAPIFHVGRNEVLEAIDSGARGVLNVVPLELYSDQDTIKR